MESLLAAAAKVEFTKVGLFLTEGKMMPPFLGTLALLLLVLLFVEGFVLTAEVLEVAEVKFGFVLELVEWC